MERMFIDSIIEDAGRTDERLIYADWLEEQDRAERAACVRMPFGTPDYDTERSAYDQALREVACAFVNFVEERDIRLASEPRLRVGRRLSDVRAKAIDYEAPEHGVVAVVRFGFVTDIAIDVEVFQLYGRDLVLQVPITDVRLTGVDFDPVHIRQIVDPTDHWRCWSVPEIPEPIFDLLEGYQTLRIRGVTLKGYMSNEEGWTALSRACVRWARREAGLPELKGGLLWKTR
jgi:uncharacterized protein (TIGR02996 family)